MLDLNKLIPPGSGWVLTNAFNINERGEILAKAAPLGFTPNDDADLGHLVLLVPCDPEEKDCSACLQDAHPNVAGSLASLARSAKADVTTHRGNAASWRRYMRHDFKP